MKTLMRKVNGVDKPYLQRWTIFKCKWFSIKIHKTILSDPADLHDHPWSYVSVILWGGYFEHTQSVKYLTTETGLYHWKIVTAIRKRYYPGCILVRKAQNPHRLEIPNNKYCITMIFTSYKWRDWGFVTKNGWKSHKLKPY